MAVFFGIMAVFSLIGVIDGRNKTSVICSTICFAASLVALLATRQLT